MKRKVRIGAVSYLNTKPLVHGMEHGLGAERIELSFDVPSRLARKMAAGELDLALLPVIELAAIPDLELVPGLGITTRGVSRSVLLVCRTDPRRVRRVALDGESRTSNALAQVLLAEAWSSRPRCEIGPLELDAALDRFDAVVRIGDKALFEPTPADVEVHDLGEVWTTATGRPFVFAAWAARPGIVDRELYGLLHESRRRGSRAVDQIAASFSWQGRYDPVLTRRYLIEHIHYRLGTAEIEAMRRFFELARKLCLIDREPEIRLALEGGLEQQNAAASAVAGTDGGRRGVK
jgi:chorismate dehydratase